MAHVHWWITEADECEHVVLKEAMIIWQTIFFNISQTDCCRIQTFVLSIKTQVPLFPSAKHIEKLLLLESW